MVYISLLECALLENDTLIFEVSSFFSRKIRSPPWLPLAIQTCMFLFVSISTLPTESSVFVNGIEILPTSKASTLKMNKINNARCIVP